MGESEHFDRDKVKRKGWFQKKEDGMPSPKNYRSSCKSGKRGYLGPRHEAHHILPQTSIEESVLDSTKDKEYLSDVQYITDWHINREINMIGLPHFHAYALYYGGKEKIDDTTDTEKEKELASWFNKFRESSRKRWLELVIKSPPEPYPIHNPVNWGHAKYNEEVKQQLKVNVWDRVNDQRKDHKLDAEMVETELNNLAKKFYSDLVARGQGASEEKWARRKDPDDNSWYKPFTMTDVGNPIFG